MKRSLLYLVFCLLSVGSRASAADSATVYLFLSERCPICKSLVPELKKLYADFQPKGVRFIGLFPNTTISNTTTIKQFAEKYRIPFTLCLDESQTYVRRFSATVTPQAFFTDADGTVLYSGLIDNGFERVGRKRQVITAHYLRDAIESRLAGKPVPVAQTDP